MIEDALGAATLALAIDAQTHHAVDALRAAGVEAVLLKGPSFARWLYPDVAARPYTDTDLLVDAEALPVVEGVLLGLGYTPYPVVPGAPLPSREWVRGEDGTIIDLHTRIWGWGDAATVWAAVQAHLETMLLGSSRVTVLDEAARTVHVVTHALQSSTYERWTRQKHEDLDRALALLPDPVWAAAARVAGEVGAAEAFAASLHLRPEGRAVCRRLGIPAPVRVSPDVAYALAGTGASGARAFDHLAHLAGARSRVAFVVRKAFPPPDAVRHALSGRDLEPRGPVRDYLRYWANLARKTPGALRAWRAARRPVTITARRGDG